MASLRLIGASFDPAPLMNRYEVRPDGTVIVPLSARLLAGRGRHCDFILQTGRIAREEAILEPTDRGWLVTNLGNNQGMFVNGQRAVRRHLVHGDRFTLGPCLFEFLEEKADATAHARAARRLELEARLAASLDDEAAWRVYADALLEAQDPLGERVRGMLPDDEKWLGQLARRVHAGELELTWTHGMIRSVRLPPHFIPREDDLVQLLSLPVARLLERLELPVLPVEGIFGPITNTSGQRIPADVQRLVATVLRQQPRPALREVSFYPSVNPAFVPTPNELGLGDVAPRLRTDTLGGRLVPWRAVELEAPDGRRSPVVPVPPPGHPLHGLARFELGVTWALVEAAPGLTLNGRDLPARGAWLWDGDRLEAAGATKLRVRVA